MAAHDEGRPRQVLLYQRPGEEVDDVEEEWKKYKDAFVGNAEDLCGHHEGSMSDLTSHNNNTPTAGRRGATLSATYLGGHLTFTSNHRHADRQTDRTVI